jgi:hypothetical protein
MAAGQLFGSAPRAWRRARQAAAHGAATPALAGGGGSCVR